MPKDIFGLRTRLAAWVAQASNDEPDNPAVRDRLQRMRVAARPSRRAPRLLFVLFAACGMLLLFATFGAPHAPTTATTSPAGTYAGGVNLGNTALATCQHNSGLAPQMVQEIGLHTADVAAKYTATTLCDDRYFFYGSGNNPPTCAQAYVFIGIMGWQKDLVNNDATQRQVCTTPKLIGQLAQYREHLQQIQQGTPDPNTINIDLNPVDWVKSAIVGIGQGIAQWFIDAANQTLDEVRSLAFMYVTPSQLSYGNGVVQAGVGWSLFALDAAVGLMLVMMGYNVIMRRHLDVPVSEVLHAAPRLVLALVAAHASLLFIGPIIELVNTLTTDFLNTLGGGKILAQSQNVNLDQAVITVIFAILDLIVELLLVLEMLVRLALLDLLIILAPWWLAATALPQTASFAQLGANAFVFALLVQFFQVATVAIGSALIATIGVNNPVVGALVGFAAYYLAFKIPGMLSHLLRSSVGAVHRDIMFAATYLVGASAAGAVGAPPAPVP